MTRVDICRNRRWQKKFRVQMIAKWEWPKMAKNWGEPRKMTHSSETEIFGQILAFLAHLI